MNFMKKSIILVMCTYASTVLGHLIYDITFESPTHTVGAPPAVGLGPNTPDSIWPGWAVGTNIAGFSSQAVFPSNPIVAGRMELFPVYPFTPDELLFSFDMAMLVSPGVGSSASGDIVAGPMFSSVGLSFWPSGEFTVWVDDPQTNSAFGNWTDNTIYHIAMLWDYVDSRFSITVDGQLAFSAPMASTLAPDLISVGASFVEPGFAIDNIRLEIIPEPQIMALLLVGSWFGFFLSRRFSRKDRG